jgi:hypothetical protein
MAYGEYRSAGRCAGKLLYQLSKIGIPLHIVETVMFAGDGVTIHYSKEPFATYTWADDDTPHFKFLNERYNYNELQDRWLARYRPVQDFVILDKNNPIDACAQFAYKGYQVSMSTIGVSEGACRSPIAIFSQPDGEGYYENHVGDFNTVEDAIRYIDGDSDVWPVRIVHPIIHEIAFITGD